MKCGDRAGLSARVGGVIGRHAPAFGAALGLLTILLFAACEVTPLLQDVKAEVAAAKGAGTVSLAAQSCDIMAGTGGTATYAVKTANVSSGTAGTVAWYTSAAGTSTETTPTGISATVGSVSSNASTVTVTVSSTVSAGTYYFKVSFGSAVSSVAKLSVNSLVIGAQTGTIVGASAGSATYAVTTTNVSDGTAGAFTWYSSSSGGSVTTEPTGITASVTSISGNAATVTMTATSSCVAGAYYFTLTEGSSVSSVKTLGVVCGAPTGLATVGGDSYVTLTWTAVSGASSYNVYRSTASGTQGSQVGSSTSASYSDASGTNNTSYYYEVTAVNAGGESAASTQKWGLPHVPLTMASVSAGIFQRDSSSSDLSGVSAFSMSACEVTGAYYAAVTGLSDPSSYSSVTNHPVEMVTWFNTLVFCNRLSIAEGRTPVYTINGSTDPSDWGSAPTSTGDSTYSTWNAVSASTSANGYRLPTEMEYMWAEMGGMSDKISGDKVNGINTGGYQKDFSGSSTENQSYTNIGDYVWYSVNAGSTTHAVGTKSANELGIYDLSGNVWEWCWDRWSDSSNTGFSSATGTGSLQDYWGSSSTSYSERAIRGESFTNSSTYMYIQYRVDESATSSMSRLGFRVVYR